MSDPLLSKMDALLKKHRGGGIAEPETRPLPRHTPPPGAWLPVLTDVIERGTPPAAKASAPTPAKPAPAGAPTADDARAEQLRCELAPDLSEAMARQVSEELRAKLDQTVEGILSQLDVNVRDIVRDAVAEKLKEPRDPST